MIHMKFSKDLLEQKQIWLYAVALLLGGIMGISYEEAGDKIAGLISPFIMVLMYSMFTQIPFLELTKAIKNMQFIIALLVGNFLIVPLVVWGLLLVFPQTAPVMVGVCLVLLAPCIDYVVVFTQLGKGNEKLMLAATPLLLLVQFIVLPFYLWVIGGAKMANIVQVEPFAEAFLWMILLPLLLAIGTQLWAKKQRGGKVLFEVVGWLPVPFMALVLFVVVASQLPNIYRDMAFIVEVIPIYLLFLVIMPILSRGVASLFRLDTGAGRALIFSMSTRNSLVVLPLAFALPDAIALIAAAVIVTQTIVELIGEIVYIKLIPHVLLKDK